LRDSDEIFHSYRFLTVTLATAQVQVECQFHHPTYPVAAYAWYLRRMFPSSGVVCDLPKLQDSPETYTPRLAIDEEMYYAAAPLQVIKPRKVQHKLCQCLVMWKRAEFLLEYLKYYTDVHGISRTIILAPDSETMVSLKWLQALYSIELIFWSHLYILMSMTSYCTLLAQQQCEWVAQWDVDEFLYLPMNARLVDYVQDIPSNAHSVLLKIHFVQMFANETVLRTPSGGVLRNFHCNANTMVTFKTLLKAHKSHATYVDKVHYCFGKKGHH
jgi:hypothetical protein